MERRTFAKEVILASLAIAAAPLVKGEEDDSGVSSFLKIVMANDSPQFDFFSIDSLGKNKLEQNVILPDAGWAKNKHLVNTASNGAAYRPADTAAGSLPA